MSNDRNTSRRGFLAAATLAAAVEVARANEDPIPIIDTHLHLYDPTRPQGVPYPKVPNPPQALPEQYREDVAPLGICGGIKVEASPWVEDNLWVLEIIRDQPIIVGMIGNLNPTRPEFREYLERYHRNKLFLGIRYGNVWEGDSLVAALSSPDFIANMKVFAQTGLTLEVANPRFDRGCPVRPTGSRNRIRRPTNPRSISSGTSSAKISSSSQQAGRERLAHRRPLKK